LTVLALVLGGFFGTTVLWAHTFHVCLAEAEFNRESGDLEVALRLSPEDLENVLSRAAGRHLVLEREEDIDERILAWLRRGLVVRPAGGDPAEIRWVGKEIKPAVVWLYFEVPLPDGLYGVMVENRLLMDLEPQQVNTMNFRDGEFHTSLSFMRGKEVQHLPLGIRD
jgi:hypothetical protein